MPIIQELVHEHELAVTGIHNGNAHRFGGFLVSCVVCGKPDEDTRRYLAAIDADGLPERPDVPVWRD